MSTRQEIIQYADHLIRAQGYNAFSFYDISDRVGIKTASIHYHFRSKSDLGVAVIEYHTDRLQELIAQCRDRSPMEKLEKLFSIYERIHAEDKVCLVGSLSTDLHTVDERMKEKLQAFAAVMLDWVSGFLEDGRSCGWFCFAGSSRTRAILIIGNLLSTLQLSRLTGEADLEAVKKAIRQDLLKPL